MLRAIRALLSRRSEFTRSVAKVSTGQVVANSITLLAIPVVARLYAPEHFGSVQLLLSIIGTATALSCLKYEFAIVVAADREEADRVAALCLAILPVTSLALFGALEVAGGPILRFFNAGELEPYAGLVALGLFMVGLLAVGRHLLVARQRYGDISRNNILQVGSTQSVSIGLGLVHPSFLGLFASQLVGHGLAALRALARARPSFAAIAHPSELFRTAAKYKKFPTVNTIGVFVNSVGAELPVFMLARFFGAEVVGYYMLTNRLLNQPIVLLGRAVQQTYAGFAARAQSEGPEQLLALFKATVKRLAVIGLVPPLLIFTIAPPLVRLLLGPEWAPIGVYMQLLAISKYTQFVTMPISTTFSVVNRQEIGVLILLVSGGVRFGAMWLFSGSPESMLLAYAIAASLFDAVYATLTYRTLLGRRGKPAGATAYEEELQPL